MIVAILKPDGPAEKKHPSNLITRSRAVPNGMFGIMRQIHEKYSVSL